MLAYIVLLAVVVDYSFSENDTVATVLEKVNSNTMAQACTTPNNQTGLVIVDWELEDNHAQYPTHYCNCSKGTKYFWPTAAPSSYYKPMEIYSYSYLAQSIDTEGTGKLCTNFCFCSTNGTCYTPTNKDSFNVDFIPYCQNSSCDIYAAIYGNSFTSETGQIIRENYLQYLYANNSYIKVASFGCSGCADLKSITCDGPNHGPPTNCGDDEIFTEISTGKSEAKCDDPSSIYYWYFHSQRNYDERRSKVTKVSDIEDEGSGNGSGSGSGTPDDNFNTTKGLPTTTRLPTTTKRLTTTTRLPTTTRLTTTTERSYPMRWPTKARCICKPGLLRNTDGKCVNATGCQPSNITCEANQIWDPCGFEQTNLCNPYPTCKIGKCVCVDGYIRAKNGSCIEENLIDGNGCDSNSTCSYQNEKKCDDPRSISQQSYYGSVYNGYGGYSVYTQCTCIGGLYRRSDGKCVSGPECKPSNITCGTNEQWDPCNKTEPDCQNPERDPTRDYSCRNGSCVCMKGFVRHNGVCVSPTQCQVAPDNQNCDKHEFWDSCGKCEANCYSYITYNYKYNRNEYYRYSSSYRGGFYPSSDGQLLNQNEYYDDDASGDIPTTPNYYSSYYQTSTQAPQNDTCNSVGRCRCQTGYVRHNDTCIPASSCYNLKLPALPTCTYGRYDNTQLLFMVGRADQYCPGVTPQASDTCGQPKCLCNSPMYVRSKFGNCVPRWACNLDYIIPDCSNIVCNKSINVSVSTTTSRYGYSNSYYYNRSRAECAYSSSLSCLDETCFYRTNCYDPANPDFDPTCDQVDCPTGYGCVMKQLVTSTSTSVPICIKI